VDWVKFDEDAGWKPAFPGNPIRGEKCSLEKAAGSAQENMALHRAVGAPE